MFFPKKIKETEEKEVKEKKIDIFDFLKSITLKKDYLCNHERFNKDYSPFMINKWLCMSDDLYCVSLGMYLSSKNFSKIAHYKFLYYSLPNKYVKFDYAKSKYEYDKELVKAVNLCYNTSEKKSCEIIRLLSTKQQEEILNEMKKKEKQE